jgi:hypothetical protein
VAVLDGQREYTRLSAPLLATFNVPIAGMEDQARAFETLLPHAQINTLIGSIIQCF